MPGSEGMDPGRPERSRAGSPHGEPRAEPPSEAAERDLRSGTPEATPLPAPQERGGRAPLFPGGLEGVLPHLVGDLAGGPAEDLRRPRDHPPRGLERFLELLPLDGAQVVRPGKRAETTFAGTRGRRRVRAAR